MTTSYQIQTTEIENQGRHRLLLHGGPFDVLDAKSIRVLLARYLYKKVKQKPAFIFVYDRPEDLHHPQGFTVARLVLGLNDDKYTVEVRDRSGIQTPSDTDFLMYDFVQNCQREQVDPGEISPCVDDVFQFLYQTPTVKFETSV